MKSVVFLYEKFNETVLQENIMILKEIWENIGYEVRELVVREAESPDVYMNELVRLEEDFLVTFAMAGFAWRGLMEQVRFNTLATMQIHILIGNLPFYDYYLQKEYGIHSFFFTDCNEIYDNWKKRYPHIPFMKNIPTLYLADRLTDAEKKINRETYRSLLKEVMTYIEEPSVL